MSELVFHLDVGVGEQHLPDGTVVVSHGAPQSPTLAAVHIAALGEGGLHSGKVPGLASVKEAFLKCHGHQARRAASQGHCCGLAPVPRATEARQVGRTAGGPSDQASPSSEGQAGPASQPGFKHQGE